MLNGVGQPSPLVSTIVSAMITPAILILATGNLIGTSMTIHGRIIDRARTLLRRRGELLPNEPERAAFAAKLLTLLKARMHFTSMAISAYYLAVGCFVASSLLIALTVALSLPHWIPAALDVAGAGLLLVGSAATFWEMRLADTALIEEIDSGFV